jgi:hypothetical protein
MTETDNQRGSVCNPRPIGYVVLMKLPGGDPWEPAALTKHADDAAKQLLVRSCFSMFPTQEAAEEAVRELEGQRWVPGVEARICAVFTANIAAPHGDATTADDAPGWDFAMGAPVTLEDYEERAGARNV